MVKKFIAQYALTDQNGDSIRVLVVVNTDSIAKVEDVVRAHVNKTKNPNYVFTMLEIQGYREI